MHQHTRKSWSKAPLTRRKRRHPRRRRIDYEEDYKDIPVEVYIVVSIIVVIVLIVVIFGKPETAVGPDPEREIHLYHFYHQDRPGTPDSPIAVRAN